MIRYRSLVALSFIVLISCPRNDPPVEPSPGTAFRDTSSRLIYRPSVPVPVSQELILAFVSLRNRSDNTIRIREIALEGARGIPEVTEVRTISILDRDDTGASIPLGRYLTYPPVTKHKGRCVAGAVTRLANYPVAPLQELAGPPVVLVRLRTVEPGSASFTGVNIQYEDDNGLFEQTINFGSEIEVHREAKPLPPLGVERRCRSETETFF